VSVRVSVLEALSEAIGFQYNYLCRFEQ